MDSTVSVSDGRSDTQKNSKVAFVHVHSEDKSCTDCGGPTFSEKAKSPLQEAIDKLPPYKSKEFSHVANLEGASPLPSTPVYRNKMRESFGSSDEVFSQQLTKPGLDKANTNTVLDVLRVIIGNNSSSVWISDTLPVDLNLPVAIPHPVLQAFVLCIDLSPFLLTVYQKANATEETVENILELAQKMTTELTTSLLDFCHCTFDVIPCCLAEDKLSVENVQEELLRKQKQSAPFYNGPKTLSAKNYKKLRAAAIAVAGVSYVPCFLQRSDVQEIWLLLLDAEWRKALSIFIEIITSKGHCHVTYSSDTEFQAKVVVLEGMKRLGFRQEVALVTDGPEAELEKYKECIKELKDQVRKDFRVDVKMAVMPAADMKPACVSNSGNPPISTRSELITTTGLDKERRRASETAPLLQQKEYASLRDKKESEKMADHILQEGMRRDRERQSEIAPMRNEMEMESEKMVQPDSCSTLETDYDIPSKWQLALEDRRQLALEDRRQLEKIKESQASVSELGRPMQAGQKEMTQTEHASRGGQEMLRVPRDYDHKHLLRGQSASTKAAKADCRASAPTKSTGTVGERTSTFILVGKCGSGKSATGNTILGKNKFPVKPRPSSETRICQMEEVVRKNRRITVFDTPGLRITEVGEVNEIFSSIARVLCDKCGTPYAFLFVMRCDERISWENFWVYQELKEHFGADFTKRVIIVFTHGDELEQYRITIQEKLEIAPEEMKTILEECSNRFVVLRNKTRHEKLDQVGDLLRIFRDLCVPNKPEVSRISYPGRACRICFRSSSHLLVDNLALKIWK